MADNKIENLPIQVVVDGHTFEIDEKGNVTKVEVKPVVKHTISPDTKVTAGTPITITIKATITEGTISKITKPDGQVVENVSETTYEVMKNGGYTFIVEGSNGATTTYTVYVTNSVGEVFSDIYKTTTDYTDDNGKTAKIPEGFAVGKSDTINTIDGGLVITDAIDENYKSIGNEFVWIPVENKSKFKRVGGFTERRREKLLSTEPYDGFSEVDKLAYFTMYNRVINNKGFYIGRYETGKENNTAVVKKNKYLYEGKWANSLTDLSGGVVQIAKNFSVGKSYQNSVDSSICYGIQWDATMQFFDNKYIDGNPDSSSYVVQCSSDREWLYGTYKNGNPNLLTGVDRGSPAGNKMKNIYDMGGNQYEATMEIQDKNPIFRGGSIANYNSGYAPSPSSHYYSGNNMLYVYAFRITLSLKE